MWWRRSREKWSKRNNYIKIKPIKQKVISIVFEIIFWFWLKPFFSLQLTTQMLEKLRTANALFHQLVEVSQILSSIFSLSILFTLTSSFISVTMELFFLIFNVSTESVFGVDTNLFHILGFLLNFGTILVILTAADLPVTEVWCYLILFRFSVFQIVFTKLLIL